MRMLSEIFALATLLGFAQPEEGYFWHVTDHHYDPTYWTDRRSCNSLHVPADLGVFGDFWCDSPWRLIEDSIDAMTRFRGNVDYIIWTGDNVAHIEDKYNSVDTNMEVIANITDALKTAFPGVKIYATMGNHDWHPSDQYPVHAAHMYNATAELWKEWITDEEQLDNFRKAGYYTVKTTHGLRIICLNSMLYFKINRNTRELEDPAGQFEWLTSVLESSKRNNEKVTLLTHISPGLKVPGNILWYYTRFHARLLDIVEQYCEVITAVHCGHYHVEQYRIVRRKNGSAGVPIFIAPSVTPWRYKEGSEEDKPHNPGIRLVKYNRSTGVVLDIEQFYMDLARSNKDNASFWRVEYLATDAYDVEDLSARSVHKLVQKLGKERKYLDKYIRYNSVLANGDAVVDMCNETCRAEHVCAMTHLEQIDFDGCVSARVSEESGWSYLHFLIAVLVIVAVTWKL